MAVRRGPRRGGGGGGCGTRQRNYIVPANVITVISVIIVCNYSPCFSITCNSEAIILNERHQNSAQRSAVSGQRDPAALVEARTDQAQIPDTHLER